MSDCYYDDAGCLICPEQAAQTYIPSRFDDVVVLGWNAGANSVAYVDGDLHAVFDVPANTVGMVIGLKASRTNQTVTSQVEHGWYFRNAGGHDLAQPIERGHMVGTLYVGRTDSTQFEIRRAYGRVTYWVDGLKVYSSMTPSLGVRVVNACLYASGDKAPGAT